MKHIKTFESVGSSKVDTIILLLKEMKKSISKPFDKFSDYEVSFGNHDGFYNLEFDQDLDPSNDYSGELDITNDEINLNEVTIFTNIKFKRKQKVIGSNISDIIKERREDLDFLEKISKVYDKFDIRGLTIDDRSDLGLFYSVMVDFNLDSHFKKVNKLFNDIND